MFNNRILFYRRDEDGFISNMNSSISVRIIDLASEVGELSKEINERVDIICLK